MAMLDYRRIFAVDGCPVVAFPNLSHAQLRHGNCCANTKTPALCGEVRLWKSGLDCSDDVLDFPCFQSNQVRKLISESQGSVRTHKRMSQCHANFFSSQSSELCQSQVVSAHQGARDARWRPSRPLRLLRLRAPDDHHRHVKGSVLALSGPQESLSWFITPVTLHSTGWGIKVPRKAYHKPYTARLV